MLSKLTSLASQYKFTLIALGVGGALLTGAGIWITNYIDEQRRDARAAAINECNEEQLRQELKLERQQREAAERRNQELLGELQTQQEENKELEQFVDNLNRDLENIPDDNISERTRRFVEILSQRATQYNNETDS